MKIEEVDFVHLAMPDITTEADGSQDAVLVRVAGGGAVGWGAAFAANALARDANGETPARDAPGLGMKIDAGGVRDPLFDCEIKLGGETLYRAPSAATLA